MFGRRGLISFNLEELLTGIFKDVAVTVFVSHGSVAAKDSERRLTVESKPGFEYRPCL